MEAQAVAAAIKNAEIRRQTIVFVDESGLSERPHRVRTWAPRGQTPVLQFHFNWKTLSAIAGVTWWSFYFRLFPGAIRSPQVVLFLQHLLRHIRGNVLVVWDGLRAHRSRLELEFLPAYAPELNPVEYLWGHWKTHELPHFCPRDLWHLSTEARRALRRMRRRSTRVSAFWKHAGLFDNCHYVL
jgi:transposase